MSHDLDVIAQLNDGLRGRYAVEALVGTGGMASVYRARDLRHERTVAIKVLREELGAVLGVQRFLAEIKTTANLQHPGLLPLFDSGETAGRLFYVMPYVDGETLRARLTRERQLPVEDAVRISVTVAAALDYAHQQGVVHRDLKPENILFQAGQPIIADFGIALAVRQAAGERLTQSGLSLGTPQYMSPEQATGEHAVDGRSDVFALAAITYEMLAGEPPHTGTSAQAIIARVITEPARSVRLSRDAVPAHVDAAVARALRKLAADRWNSAREFAEALSGRIAVTAVAAPGDEIVRRAADAEVRVSRASVGRALPWLTAVVFAVAASLGWWRVIAAPELPALRLRFAVPAGLTMTSVAVLSPDGLAMAFAARRDTGTTRLYYQPLDELNARELPGTEGASVPSFSRDGRLIAFATGRQVRTIAIDGSDGRSLGDFGVREGARWTDDGRLLLSSMAGNIDIIDPNGGRRERLTQLDTAAGELFHTHPQALPDGRHAIFTIWNRAFQRTIGVIRLDARTVTRVRGFVGSALGVVDGRLVFAPDDGTVAVAPFDPTSTREILNATTVLDGVRQAANRGALAFLSASGTLAFHREDLRPAQLILHGESGAVLSRFPERRRYSDPQFSPDGSRIAVAVATGGESDIWVVDLASQVSQRLTVGRKARAPAWTADGRRLGFVAPAADGVAAAWWMPVDMSAPPELLGATPSAAAELDFSPDGRVALVRTARHPVTGRDLWLVPLQPGRAPRQYVTAAGDQNQPSISPDGRYAAYVSSESGGARIFVRPFPDGGASTVVSAGNGFEPRWTRDGALLYRTADSLVRVTLDLQGAPKVLRRKMLFSLGSPPSLTHQQYSVAPDGKRFALVHQPVDDHDEVIIVLNWTKELRRILSSSRR